MVLMVVGWMLGLSGPWVSERSEFYPTVLPSWEFRSLYFAGRERSILVERHLARGSACPVNIGVLGARTLRRPGRTKARWCFEAAEALSSQRIALWRVTSQHFRQHRLLR